MWQKARVVKTGRGMLNDKLVGRTLWTLCARPDSYDCLETNIVFPKLDRQLLIHRSYIELVNEFAEEVEPLDWDDFTQA